MPVSSARDRKVVLVKTTLLSKQDLHNDDSIPYADIYKTMLYLDEELQILAGAERGKNKFFFKKPADDYPITDG